METERREKEQRSLALNINQTISNANIFFPPLVNIIIVNFGQLGDAGRNSLLTLLITSPEFIAFRPK